MCHDSGVLSNGGCAFRTKPSNFLYEREDEINQVSVINGNFVAHIVSHARSLGARGLVYLRNCAEDGPNSRHIITLSGKPRADF